MAKDSKRVPGDMECFVRAKARGQKTFTLVAQDRTTPRVICAWIMENIETAPEDKLRRAMEDAIEMRRHYPRKYAD